MDYRGVRTLVWILILAAVALPASAQLGNSSLQGAFNFRYVGATASCDCPVSAIGSLTFDGAGKFTVTAQGSFVGSSGGASQTLTPATSGTYTVFSSGSLYMTNPFAPAASGTLLYGGVAQGSIVVASSTESNNLDMFVAMPAATSGSNAVLTGTYNVGSLEFAGGSIGSTRNTFFNMAADGKGGLGNVAIKGSSIPLGNTPTTQTSSGATYSVTANGSGTMTFPPPSGVAAANQLLSGAKNLYVSQDGSLFIAGTPNGYEMVIGIKAMQPPVPNPPISGQYFLSELEYNSVPGDFQGVYGYYGATSELGDKAATELAHFRINSDISSPYDFTTTYNYNFDSTGVDSTSIFAAGGNGNLFLYAGAAGDYLLSLGVRLQPITGTGVFLSPVGVVNAATYAPFTAQLSPGELITLFGSGMAPAGTLATASAPFPNTLAGVGVTINNTPAPVYVVTPTQISCLVPYSLDPTQTSIAQVQVSNNGTLSNVVTEYLGATSPGVFTNSQNGLGPGAILHANFTPVNASSPATAGETVLIYVTGLGAVAPAVPAGAPAPSNPLSKTVNTTYVYVDGLQADVLYSGLAPGFAGLYQLNVTIPTKVSAGKAVYLEIDGLDAVTLQAQIPIK
jgi:uncharacterized protein (TIGR03437 family)